MNRSLIRRVTVGVLVVAATAGVAMLIAPHALMTRMQADRQTVYYCPMHPSYTSDRPGDCPICNMKLVKKESVQRTAVSGQEKTEAAKDICYMHNCPMAREGKPCPMLVVAKEGERVICPICGAHVTDKTAQARTILYWTDPMIPGFKAPGPGKSPMGMDLVPVYEEAAPSMTNGAAPPPGYAPVLVTPQKQLLIGVTTDVATTRHLRKTIRTVGTVAHDPELYQAQAEYIQTIRSLAQAQASGNPEVIAQAQRLVEAASIHLTHLGLNQELIEELATKQEADHGLLIGRSGEPVWVYAKFYEEDLPLVRVGQEVDVETPALAGRSMRGTVRAIDPMVDAMTRTVRVRAQLDNPEGLLKPDMYVNVLLGVELGERLSVPKEAVFETGRQHIVFVDKGQGLFEPRDVRLGVKADDFVEIADGVAEGERVITSGNFLIDSESRLKAALQNLGGGEAHHHGP